MTSPEPKKISVIGGGFSGLMTAVNLARLSRRPLHITLINCHRPTGRGVAYSSSRMEHLLNVAARNMSALRDVPDHFLKWLRTRSEYDSVPAAELRERYIPRLIYGDYLRTLMHQHLETPDDAALVQTTLIDGEAIDVQRHTNGAVVHLADGSRVEADRVVLATGNEAPAGFPGSEELRDHPAWIGNPWQAWETRLPAPGGTLVLLGTGLTTVDAIITLRCLGWQGLVHAVSRNGWLPQSHFRGIEYPDFPEPDLDLASMGLEELLSLIHQHCARLRDMGTNPAIIVDKMRPHTQRIWQNFTASERAEFIRRHAARWNIMRHRIAPEIHAQVATAEVNGLLRLHAANVQRVEAQERRIRVHLSGGKTLSGDLVINATGPHAKLAATDSVLLRNLLASGLICTDEMGMGVRVDPDHTVIDRDGRRSAILLALGSLLRGTLWETIAVPELRDQAFRVAQALLDQPMPAEPIEQPPTIEYMI